MTTRLRHLVLVLSLSLACSACNPSSNPVNRPSASQPPVVIGQLLIAGRVNFTSGTVYLMPSYIIPDVEDLHTPTEGDVTLQLLGPRDTVLATYPLPAYCMVDGQPSDANRRDFSERVPWVQGVQRMAIISGTLELASVTPSAHTPQVTLLYPNGGESLDGGTILRWEASDQDGDRMEYLPEYSPDNGQTWQPLSSTSETSLPVDLSWLPGGDQALIRVLATDGLNTGWDVSDAPFSVPQKRPEPRISGPGKRMDILPDTLIMLDGQAYDVEDGTMPGEALSWQSDLDGPLGTGEHMTRAGWTPGVHTITLTATDSDGMTGTTSITMTVKADADADHMPDDWEVLHGLDPARADSSGDLDDDSVANYNEYVFGTLPDNPDTDGDGFPDGLEFAAGADPLQPAQLTTNVTLQFSGEIQYRADRWRSFTKPSLTMLPSTYPMSFDGYPLFLDVGGPEVAQSIVIVRLLDSTGKGIAGGVVEYYENGRQPIQGATDVNGDLVCVIPGIRPSLTFRMTYEGTSQEKTQDIAGDSYIVFRS